MGINKFRTLFQPTATIKGFRTLKDATIVVDGSGEIHRAIKGTQSVNQLTSADGERTQHINVILANILERRQLNIQEIWIFDNPESNVDKKEELEARRATRAISSSKARAAELESLEFFKFEKASAELNAADFHKVQKLLNYLGIRWTTAPKDVEAEKVCAALSEGKYVLSGDTDSIVYGAELTLMRSFDRAKKGELQIYQLSAILNEYEITREELVRISILLGTDFNKGGRRGIGPKKVMGLYDSTELTPEEQRVYNLFMDPVDLKSLKWNEHAPDIAGMVDWLVQDLSFKRDRLVKLIEKRIPGAT